MIRGQCWACDRYERRNGSKRPIEKVIAHNLRRFEKEVERDLLRRMVGLEVSE